MKDKLFERKCEGCGKLESVRTKAQLKRKCRSCSQLGNTSSKNFSHEAIEKMAASKRGKPSWNSGKTGIYTEEVRIKMGADKVGKAQSLETRIKKSEALKEYYDSNISPLKGRSLSEEHKNKIAEALNNKEEKEIELPKSTKSYEYSETRIDKYFNKYNDLSEKGKLYFNALNVAGSERKAAISLGVSRNQFLNTLFSELKICVQCKKEEPKENCTRCDTCLILAKSNKTKEEKAIYNKEYKEKNRDKLAIYAKEYQKINLEQAYAARSKWDQTEKGKMSAQRRRARRSGARDPGMPLFDYDLFRNTIKACESCGTENNLTLDHHIPLSKKGILSLNNSNILCNSCNSRKKAKLPKDFFTPEKLKAIEDKFAKFEAFKEVTTPKEYCVNINPNRSRCRNFIEYHHYLHTSPGVVWAATLEYQGRVLGVAVFSNPSRQNIEATIGGKVLELSRFFVLEGTPKNTESWFLSKCLNFLSKETKWTAIVSYADTTEGHSGIIYQACNFVFMGKTDPNYHYETLEGKRIHKRQVWARATMSGIKEAEQAITE